MKTLPLSPTELDKQSLLKIDKWLDIDSEECKDKDPDYALTKRFLRILKDDLFTDKLGRIWGRGEDSRFYPFHFNIGKKLYGFRVAKKAAN